MRRKKHVWTSLLEWFRIKYITLCIIICSWWCIDAYAGAGSDFTTTKTFRKQYTVLSIFRRKDLGAASMYDKTHPVPLNTDNNVLLLLFIHIARSIIYNKHAQSIDDNVLIIYTHLRSWFDIWKCTYKL